MERWVVPILSLQSGKGFGLWSPRRKSQSTLIKILTKNLKKVLSFFILSIWQ
jgi:hypothetical protein